MKALYRHSFAYTLILPTVIVLFGIVFFPIISNVWISLTDTSRQFFKGHFVGFANYLEILAQGDIWRIGLQTIIWTVSVLGASLVIGLFLALLLREMPKLGKIFQTLWMIPWVMPEITAALVWVLLLHPEFGASNYALMAVRAIRNPIPWLSMPGWSLLGVIIAAVWKAFPFDMVMFYAALQSLPDELADASKIDGTTAWQFLLYVQLPWIKPVAAIASLLGFVWIFNWFTLIYVMTKGGPGDSTMIVPIYIYKKALEFFHLGYAAAFSMLMLIFMSLFIFMYVVTTMRDKE